MRRSKALAIARDLISSGATRADMYRIAREQEVAVPEVTEIKKYVMGKEGAVERIETGQADKMLRLESDVPTIKEETSVGATEPVPATKDLLPIIDEMLHIKRQERTFYVRTNAHISMVCVVGGYISALEDMRKKLTT